MGKAFARGASLTVTGLVVLVTLGPRVWAQQGVGVTITHSSSSPGPSASPGLSGSPGPTSSPGASPSPGASSSPGSTASPGAGGTSGGTTAGGGTTTGGGTSHGSSNGSGVLGQVGRGPLPHTGAEIALYVLIGLGFVVVGLSLIGAARIRRRTPGVTV